MAKRPDWEAIESAYRAGVMSKGLLGKSMALIMQP